MLLARQDLTTTTINEYIEIFMLYGQNIARNTHCLCKQLKPTDSSDVMYQDSRLNLAEKKH